MLLPASGRSVCNLNVVQAQKIIIKHNDSCKTEQIQKHKQVYFI